MDWKGVTLCQLVGSALILFVKHNERPPFSVALMRANLFSEHIGILTELMWSRENLGKSPSDKAKQLLPHLKQLRSEVAAITHEEFAAYKKQVLDRFDEVITTLETVKP